MKLDSYLCPGCGDDVPIGPRGCPRCTKPPRPRRRRTERPRSRDRSHDALDLPDEDFDYDDFIAREFGRVPHRRVGIRWYWWLTAIIILILMICGLVGRLI